MIMRKGVENLDTLVKDILPVGAAKPNMSGPGVEFCMCRMNGSMLRKSIQFLEFEASLALNCELELVYLQKGCVDVGFKIEVEHRTDYERIYNAFHEGEYDALIAKHEIFRINFINWPLSPGATEDQTTLEFEFED